MNKNKKLYVFFRHHKCAGTWMHKICKNVCKFIGLNYAYLPQDIKLNSKTPITSKTINEFIIDNSIDFISYGNAPMDIVKNFPVFRGFNIIRDPRDILISAYFSHLYSHNVKTAKKISKLRMRLNKLSLEDGILLELDEFMPNIFKKINDWDYSMKNVFETRYEYVTSDPENVIPKIFAFLGLLNKYIDHDSLIKIVHNNSFEKLSGGRNINKEDIKSHYRKGIAGDWKNHFKDIHRKRFKELYNDLLIKLNYEKDDNW